MGNNVLKVILAVLFLGNLGWLGWNGYLFFGELADVEAATEKATDDIGAIERRRLLMKSDLDRIVENKYVKVKDVNVALQRQLEAVRIDPFSAGVIVPTEPKEGLAGGRAFDEQVWKISFNKRDQLFSARTLARFCMNVEKDMPGYQIKAIDLGQREKVWGQDLWRPVGIEVRRLTRREKK